MTMHAALYSFLSQDHERLDALLRVCREAPESTLDSWDELRRGLLRHIGIEERILFPELKRRRGLTPLHEQLHRDHAALAALLVPPPTREGIDQIVSILVPHNELEEEQGGLYELIEELAGEELEELMTRAHAIPPIPPAPFSDTPLLRRTIDQLVSEAAAGRRALRS